MSHDRRFMLALEPTHCLLLPSERFDFWREENLDEAELRVRPRAAVSRTVDGPVMDGKPKSLGHPRYPRSNAYDPDWVFENQMGPNALWLMESLTEVLPIQPGMRVLDLGCGRAMTSIFLAKEFGAQSLGDGSVDRGLRKPGANPRAPESRDLVVPIHAEAHTICHSGPASSTPS